MYNKPLADIWFVHIVSYWLSFFLLTQLTVSFDALESLILMEFGLFIFFPLVSCGFYVIFRDSCQILGYEALSLFC